MGENGVVRRLDLLAASCLVLVALPCSSQGNGGSQEPAPGQIAENVTCRGDAGQRYAVFLPSGYSHDRAWPILYAFDAGAKGLLPVQRFQDAAERYGYIVAGSNNSRNGPVALADDALRAMMADTASRFAIDPRRIYLAGFSGGARAAVRAAIALGDHAAGVIGAAAGFPIGVEPTSSMSFAYYGTTGTDDFSYPEMTTLDETLGRLGLPHRLEIFDGGHDWPPADVCVRAIEWMEAEAMRSRRRVRDEAIVDRIAARAASEARAEEEAGRVYHAWSRYSTLAATLAGFREVAPYEQKARQLAASPEVQRAFARAGNKKAAVQALRNAVTKGVGDAAAIEAEADFESLRGEEGFRELLRSLKK
jgi:poly(3-hydroxybutyrate) depolymerase